LADGYYASLYSGAVETGTGISSIPAHLYDSSSRSLSFNAAEAVFQATAEKAALDVGLAFGPWADAMAGSETALKNVGHAVLSVQPWPAWSLSFGKMYTHVGLEGARSQDQVNYSRSWLFIYGTPTWHTGLRMAWAPATTPWFASVHVYNGWGIISDNNAAKTYGVTLGRRVGSATVTYNAVAGPEQPGSTSHWRTVSDLILTANAGSLGLSFDAVYGTEAQAPHTAGPQDATWYGMEFIGSWAASASTKLSARLEWYRDETGYTLGGTPANLTGLTLTASHRIAQPVEVRLESRFDHAEEDVFRYDGGLRDQQATVTLALLASW
jgi:hypothetical protein